MIFKTYYKSPFAALEITANDFAIIKLNFLKKFPTAKNSGKIPGHLKLTVKQLNEYFTHKRRCFDLPVLIDGTDFQMKVWMHLIKINYSSTASYADIAKAIKKPQSFRAVGNAVGLNPLPVIIPCHRIIHSNGDILGYTGGNHIKKWLLRHEGIIS
jgi:methylated-DNA-[protein]-cysteine S-methyltransferase